MIEEIKGLVGGIQRFSTSDGPGIRTTVFLKGCPLACQWCHNPELIYPKQQLMRSVTKCIGCGYCADYCPQGAIKAGSEGFYVDWATCDNCLECTDYCTAEAMSTVGDRMTVDEVLQVVLRDAGFYKHSGGGLTISGGELLMQAEFAAALQDAALEAGVSTVLDTSGFGDTQKLLAMAKKAEWILFDMKSIDSKIHKEYTGQENALILKNLRALAADSEIRSHIWMRMPLIAGVNDTPDIIRDTLAFYQENRISKVTLLAYHELGINKCRGTGREPHVFTAPEHARLEEICNLFVSAGMDAEILGEEIS